MITGEAWVVWCMHISKKATSLNITIPFVLQVHELGEFQMLKGNTTIKKIERQRISLISIECFLFNPESKNNIIIM